MLEDILQESNKIKFKNRPMSVPYNYRITYKISQIVLILGSVCKRGGCSTIKLNIISNAMSSNNTMKELLKVLDNKKETISVVRFEPATTRTVNYGIAENFIEMQNSNLKLKLTEKR